MTDDRRTTPRRPLIIGYGNSLRRDDGVGWHVAQRLVDDPRAAGVDVIAAHQLTPELAVDLHDALVVVLVDACVDEQPGRWRVSHLVTATGTGTATAGTASHACTPQALIALARNLYGRVAPVTLVAVGTASFGADTASFGAGDAMTDLVADAVPALAEVALRLALTGHDPGSD